MSYIACKKIANLRKVKKQNGSLHYMSGIVLMAFEKEDGIQFNVVFAKNGKPLVVGHIFKLKKTITKDGRINFNFYQFRLARDHSANAKYPTKIIKIKIDSPESLNTMFISTSKHNKSGLSKSQKHRLYVFIKNYLKRNGISARWMSKNPIALINQLCYPGLKKVDDKVACKKVDAMFKGDIWKTTLNTNGKKSKALLLDCLSKYDTTITHLIKLIKQLYGLDKAQQFMEIICAKHLAIRSHRPSLIALIKGIKKHFSKISFNKMMGLLETPVMYTSDCIRLIELLELNQETLPTWNTIAELHDELSVRHRALANAQKAKLYAAKTPVYEPLTRLESKWNDDNYQLVLPQIGSDLLEWSNYMKNCVSGYIQSVYNKQYYILAIYKDGAPYINIGFNVQDNKLLFSQWSCKRNTPIPREDRVSIARQFIKVGIKLDNTPLETNHAFQ